MLQPRSSSRLSFFITSPLVPQILPTGNCFGGSSLKIVRFQALVLPIASRYVLNGDRLPSISTKQTSPLIVEVGKIILLTLWFWCLIGANLCSDSINSIASLCTQDV
jgi:hypothetical protein